MLYRKPLRIALLLGMMCGAAVSFGQSSTDDEGKVILAAFATQKIPEPQLGWVLPNGELVTEVAGNEVTILDEGIPPKAAPQIGVIPAASVKAYVNKNKVDCDQLGEDKPVPLYRYDAKMPKSKVEHQVFVSSGRRGLALKAGYREYKATEAELAPVWQAMRSSPGQRRLTRSVEQPDGAYYYTIAATYMRDGRLLREGLFLMDRAGKIAAKMIEDINGEAECDGCEAPTYREGLKYVYPVLNLITVPGSPYPILMEDSSTAEGRAIDLLTFTAAGKSSQYRIYEYIVTCVLGPDPNVAPAKP